jgi:hypothetical protein
MIDPTETSLLDSIITNAAIWHNRVLKNVARETVNFFELDSSQVGIDQNIICEQNPIEIGSHQIGISQIAATEISFIQTALTEHGFIKNDSTQISSTQIFIGQVSSGKIPLSSSITLQQFLSSHDFDLQNRTLCNGQNSFRPQHYLTSK